MSKRAGMAAGLGLLNALVISAGSGCDSAPRPIERDEFAVAATLEAFDGWDQRPERIVLIVADTLRRDVLSAYGGAADTPHLDALAARSQVFQNSFSSYHQTSMSMGSLFTGLTPSIETGDSMHPLKLAGYTWCGMARFSGPEQKTCIPDTVPTLGQAMQSTGYWTIGVASNAYLFAPFGADRGFDDWNEIGERMSLGMTREIRGRITSSRAADKVNRAAFNALLRRKSDSFFLYIHYMDVHDYLEVPGFGDKSTEYLASLRVLDAAVGEVLGWLEQESLLDGTAIVFTADHGERLKDQHFIKGENWHLGNPSFEEVISVPLFVTPPISDDEPPLMRTEDTYRLLTRMAGSDLGGRQGLERNELFLTEATYQTYRRGRWKSYLRREDGVHFLVDLESDPTEMADVAAEHPEVVADHTDRIAELTQTLAAQDAAPAELSEEDIRRLRELGYVE